MSHGASQNSTSVKYNFGELKKTLKKIKSGENVDDSQLLPFLAVESKDERCRNNLQLAEAFYQRHQSLNERGSLQRASHCIDRAWLLSRYALDILPLHIEIKRALGDAAANTDALKRAGIEQATRGNFDKALALFDRWSYADSEFTGIDTHNFDPDIMACVERMSILHRFETRTRVHSGSGQKIRLAYLMHGLTDVNSVLVKIDRVFARLHDKSRFEVAYFAADTEAAVAASPDAQATIQYLKEHGCDLSVAPNTETLYAQLLTTGRQIKNFNPDILITGAALGTFKNYFIASLKPAPVTVALLQGPSPQFCWHSFDHSISWFQTTLLDCPADCSYVPLEFKWPQRDEAVPVSKTDLGLPAHAAVMVSGGRWQKFRDPEYWRAMMEVLAEHPDLYWLLIGINEDQTPFLGDLVTPDVRARIHFHGWRVDYLQLLAAADLLVDSYPVGGGVLLMEAMSLGLPVLSFKHDYVSVFSNNDCSGGDEIVGTAELLIERGDFAQLKKSVAHIIEHESDHRRLSAECFEWIHRTRGNPARMVRRCEDIYESVLKSCHETLAAATDVRAGDETPELALAAAGEDQKLEKRHRVQREQSLLLNRRADELNRRADELDRRDADYNTRFLRRVERGLYRRWLKFRE